MDKTTNSPAQTRQYAAAFAARLPPGAIVALYGAVGAGKTCFAQGVARGLGVKEPVTSPTFIIINEHAGRLPLFHMDLYRLHSADEALHAGLDEYFDRGGVTMIEWAERIEHILPVHTIRVHIASAGRNQRRIMITA